MSLPTPTNVVNRLTLNGYFTNGAKPTGDQFASLIASGINQVEDGVIKVSGSALAVEAAQSTPGQPLTNSPVLELWESFQADTTANWVLQLRPNDSQGFAITDGVSGGMARFFISKDNGNIGIGTTSPSAQLTIVPSPNVTPLQIGLDASPLLTVDTSGNVTINGQGTSVIAGSLNVGPPQSDSGGVSLYVNGDITAYNLLWTKGYGKNTMAGSLQLGSSGSNSVALTATGDIEASGRISATGAVAVGGAALPASGLAVTGPVQITDSSKASWVSGTLAIGKSSAATNSTLQVMGILAVGGDPISGSGDNYIQAVGSCSSPVRIQVINSGDSSAELRATSAKSDFAWCADATNSQFRVWDFGTPGGTLLELNGYGNANARCLMLPGHMAVGSTNVPTAALDVAGAIQASDVLKINGIGGSFVAGSLSVGKTTAVISGLMLDVDGNIGCSQFYANNGSATNYFSGNLAVGQSAVTSGFALDVNGAVHASSDVQVDGTLKVGGSSNLAGIKRILVATVSMVNSSYSVDDTTLGFKSLSHTTTGVFVLTVATDITLVNNKTVCLATLGNHGSSTDANDFQDNSISAAFDASAGTVTVRVWSNSVTQTLWADGSGSDGHDQDDFEAVTQIGKLQDSPFTLMVIQLG